MWNFLLRLAITMIALKGADLVLWNFDLHGGFWPLVWFSIVLGLLNWLVKPILVFFSIPLIIVTVGIFYLCINALMIYLTSMLFPGVLNATGFGIFLGSVAIAILHWMLTALFRVKKS